MYLINFAGNGGYILLAEDRRDEPILALATEGNLNPEDELPAPALMMLSNALSGRNMRRIDHINDECPINELCPLKPDPPVGYTTYTEYGPWEVTESVEPMVRVFWGQGAPFNAKLELIDGKLPPVGCVATALMQLMSYHRLPASYNWDEILYDKSSPYSADVLSSLGKEIGRPELLYMKYSLEGSGAPSDNVPRTLRHYGYTSGEVEEYDAPVINREIKSGRPVYVSGYSHVTREFKGYGALPFLFKDFFTTFSGGHAFLLDGLKVLRRKIKSVRYPDGVIQREWYETKELVHCKFGWGSTSPDAYYFHKDFNTNKGGAELRVIIDRYGEDHYYRFNLEMITSIQPR